MKPKAMVTMARYGPVTRSAGIESAADIAGLGGENSNPIGAERQESGLAERDLAGEAEQHIQPNADQCRGRQRSQKIRVIAGREQADGDRGGADQHRGDDGGDGLHTRTLVRRPNSPDGASTRAAMTAENVTIWVLPEPSHVVAQASTRP